jgi:hypothetical protein
MKKILYFDNWDKGYRNFLRLDAKFKENNCETVLLHTTSWGEKNTKKEKVVENLIFRDISYYNTCRIKKCILQEKPTAIIMLNLSFIIDRTIIKICKKLSIEVFYLSHGMLIPIESINDFKASVIKNKSLLSRVNKNNIYRVFNYIIELKSISKIIIFFRNAIKTPTEYSIFPKYSYELDVKKAFVYYPSDFNTMVNEFGFPKNKIEIVGNPELDSFYNTKIKDKKEFCVNELNIETENYIAYFVEGLSDGNNWVTKKWILFLDDLNQAITKKEHQLVIKLHPRRDITNCISFFNNNNIKYILDVDFKNFIYHSKFAVSHFSSVVLYALLLNKKVKSPRWGISIGIEEKYPKEIVEYFYSKRNFENTFLEVNVNKETTEDYLLKSVGKVDGKSIDRIVNSILKGI